MCVIHYILGIGDRHLSNTLLDTTTGGVVGIDFGHAFGSATQVRMYVAATVELLVKHIFEFIPTGFLVIIQSFLAL